MNLGHEASDTGGARVPETPDLPRNPAAQPGATPEWPPAAAGAVVAALGALTLPPLIAPALRPRSAGWVALGRAGAPTPGRAALPPKGAVARTTLTRDVADAYLPRAQQTTTVFVANLGEGGYRVFDGRCTHLGCPLVWDQATRRFDCRCHGAVFDDRGEVVSGPAPRPLDRYATRMKDGVLYVGDLQDG